MASTEVYVNQMQRDGITTPSTELGYLTLTTTPSTAVYGGAILGTALTTAIQAEIAVDPDDKVGFVFTVSATTTFETATLSLTAGQGWRAGSAKSFTITSNSSAAKMYFIGPVESANYVRYDSTMIGVGKPYVKFTLSTAAVAGPRGYLAAFKLPVVKYDT